MPAARGGRSLLGCAPATALEDVPEAVSDSNLGDLAEAADVELF
jgi:hypothetical protein